MATSVIKYNSSSYAMRRVEQDIDDAPFGLSWTSGSNYVGGYGLIFTFGSEGLQIQLAFRSAPNNIQMRRYYNGVWSTPIYIPFT